MKRSVILLVALLTVVSGAYAQRDDMYYRPSKKDKVDEAANTSEKAANSNTINYSTTYDDYDGYTDDEIDAYNRRYDMYGDTLYLGDGEGDSQSSYDGEYEQEYYNNDYECTARIIRFHSPSISIYYGFGSPFYWDYYDYVWGWGGFYDPWYYDAYWGWNWSWGWRYPYYGWGWYHRPWHYWAWDYRPHYHHGHYGWRGNGGRYFAGNVHSSRIGSAGGRIWTSGRNYRDMNSESSSAGTRRNYTYRNNRLSDTNNRNSSVRSFGNRNNSRYNDRNTNRTPSRNNSVSGIRPSTSTRSFGSGSSVRSSRSSGGGSFRSGGGMGGGTRSFGGGGGGGRRR